MLTPGLECSESNSIAESLSAELLPIEADIATNQFIADLVALESDSTPWPWTDSQLADSVRQGHYCYRFSCGQEVVGYCVLMQSVEKIEILNLVIFSEFQNRGFGKLLLRRIFAIGQQMGVEMLWLEVRETNVIARRLYCYEGFVEDGIRKDYYPSFRPHSDRIHINRREAAILMHRKVT